MTAFSEEFPQIDLTNKRILICRAGGIGDVLFITPTIKALKRKYPGLFVGFATSKGPCYEVMLHCGSVVDAYEDYEDYINFRLKNKYHAYHDFFGCLEHNPWASKMNAQDIPATIANVKLLPEDRIYPYVVEPDELWKAEVFISQIKQSRGIPESTKIIMVQAKASSPLRSWPQQHVKTLCDCLAADGYMVLFVGSSRDAEEFSLKNVHGWKKNCMPTHPWVIDIRGRFPLSASVALLQKSDLFIGPDSGLTHLASAVKTPTVALYGPFPGKNRTKYYENCVTLEQPMPCAPCNSHGEYIWSVDKQKMVMMKSTHPLRWQGICPQTRTHESPCLMMIEPHNVLDVVSNFMNGGIESAKETGRKLGLIDV